MWLLFVVLVTIVQHLELQGPQEGVPAGPVEPSSWEGPAPTQAPHPGASLSCWDTGFVRLGHADWYANLWPVFPSPYKSAHNRRLYASPEASMKTIAALPRLALVASVEGLGCPTPWLSRRHVWEMSQAWSLSCKLFLAPASSAGKHQRLKESDKSSKQ